MKIKTHTILAAAAFTGLLTGCTTAAKSETKGSVSKATASDKSNCGSKSKCTSKATCRAKGNCSAKGSNQR